MATESEIRAAAVAQGQSIKRINMVAAVAFGGLLALILARLWPTGPLGWLAGLGVGLLYANAYEYFFHRFLLHRPGSRLTAEHMRHHETVGLAEEALYVNFFGRPWIVVLVFAVNSLPFIAGEWLLQVGIAPGVLVGFVVYFLASEEIHWRFHVGGWPGQGRDRLAAWLNATRAHHLIHHGRNDGRFNVFLPLWDWLFGRPI